MSPFSTRVVLKKSTSSNWKTSTLIGLYHLFDRIVRCQVLVTEKCQTVLFFLFGFFYINFYRPLINSQQFWGQPIKKAKFFGGRPRKGQPWQPCLLPSCQHQLYWDNAIVCAEIWGSFPISLMSPRLIIMLQLLLFSASTSTIPNSILSSQRC